MKLLAESLGGGGACPFLRTIPGGTAQRGKALVAGESHGSAERRGSVEDPKVDPWSFRILRTSRSGPVPPRRRDSPPSIGNVDTAWRFR